MSKPLIDNSDTVVSLYGVALYSQDDVSLLLRGNHPSLIKNHLYDEVHTL